MNLTQSNSLPRGMGGISLTIIARRWIVARILEHNSKDVGKKLGHNSKKLEHNSKKLEHNPEYNSKEVEAISE